MPMPRPPWYDWKSRPSPNRVRVAKIARSASALAKMRGLNSRATQLLLSPTLAMTGKRSRSSAESRSLARGIFAETGTGMPAVFAVANAMFLSSTRCTIAGGGAATVQNRVSSAYAALTICSDASLVGTTHFAPSERASRPSSAADSPTSPCSRTVPAIAREEMGSGCPRGVATTQRTPERCSDRAIVTSLRGSAPTMMTVEASPAPSRCERAGDDAASGTRAANRSADLLFENIRVDEELARPAQVLELPVLTIDGERALHAAAQLRRAVRAHARAHIGVRAPCGVEKFLVAGDLMQQQPAVRDLR